MVNVVQSTQVENPHAPAHEKSGEMGFTNMLAKNKKTHFQMMSDPILSPQTPGDGVTAGEHRHLPQAGPLCTEVFPAKHLNREHGSLKPAHTGVTAFAKRTRKLYHSPVSHSRRNRRLRKHGFKPVEMLDHLLYFNTSAMRFYRCWKM